ncbi:hypothetical protein B0H19DRAFT_1055209 [Mycena capillaripes]|nr:hypothetical protein B0H19DRAFT_1055209 [Mycena capillaripes]
MTGFLGSEGEVHVSAVLIGHNENINARRCEHTLSTQDKSGRNCNRHQPESSVTSKLLKVHRVIGRVKIRGNGNVVMLIPAPSMPLRPTTTQTRLNIITTCLISTANTLEILSKALAAPFLAAIFKTTHSVGKCAQTIKQNKTNCAQLLEETYKLLHAIIFVLMKSNTGGELQPDTLKHIANFTETLYKIHTFVDAQRTGSKIKTLFRRGEMSALLKDCKTGLEQAFIFLQIQTASSITDIAEMQKEAQKRHQEVLHMAESLSDGASSDGASSV